MLGALLRGGQPRLRPLWMRMFLLDWVGLQLLGAGCVFSGLLPSVYELMTVSYNLVCNAGRKHRLMVCGHTGVDTLGCVSTPVHKQGMVVEKSKVLTMDYKITRACLFPHSRQHCVSDIKEGLKTFF